MYKQLIGTLLLIVLAACSSIEEPSVERQLADRGYVIVAERNSVPGIRINGWSELDDRHVIVTVGVNDKYLVELQGRCINLDSALTIAFSARGATSRLDRFDTLYVRAPGGRVERCNIRNIYTLATL